MPTKKKPAVRQPGTEAETQGEAGQAPGVSNVDEAIAAAQSGRARKVAKPRAPVAPSKIKGDPERPPEMPVNQKREMSYADAMELLEAGKLTRSVLTEKGWVAAPNKKPPTVVAS